MREKENKGTGIAGAAVRRPKAFPFRGRWHGEAVTDEVVSL